MLHPFRASILRSRSFSALISLVLLFALVPAAQAATPSAASASSQDVVAGSRLDPILYRVELYALRLANCFRTGGTLRADASCAGYGSGSNGGYRSPLILTTRASDGAARPYAKLLVSLAECNHWFDGAPDDRLRRAGVSFGNYGENIGCRDGDKVYKSILASHLNFQSEKSYNGWHWRNIKNPDLKFVGIGVWRVGNRIRFVQDFYRP